MQMNMLEGFGTMTGFKKVFVDTASLIYYLERNEQYFEKMKAFFQDCCERDVDIVTSAVTYEEYLVYPYRQNKTELIENFESFISNMGIRIINIDKEIAREAAKLRGKYPYFKAMDALQIASAIETACNLFLTNDKQLRQEREILCLTLDDLTG